MDTGKDILNRVVAFMEKFPGYIDVEMGIMVVNWTLFLDLMKSLEVEGEEEKKGDLVFCCEELVTLLCHLELLSGDRDICYTIRYNRGKVLRIKDPIEYTTRYPDPDKVIYIDLAPVRLGITRELDAQVVSGLLFGSYENPSYLKMSVLDVFVRKVRQGTENMDTLQKILRTILVFKESKVWLDMKVFYYFYQELERINSPLPEVYEVLGMMWQVLEKMDLISFSPNGNFVVMGKSDSRPLNPKVFGFQIVYFRSLKKATQWRALLTQDPDIEVEDELLIAKIMSRSDE